MLAYEMTDSFPKHELYGLTQQARRASVSIPSNIAEGWGRGHSLDYLRFLRTSRGSLFELQTQILIGARRRYIDDCSRIMALSDEVSRVLQGLIASLERIYGKDR
jgi:four helix bundle protein